MSNNHEYQPIGNARSKIGQQQSYYQNVSVSASGRGQTKVTGVEGDYELPESDVSDNQGTMKNLTRKACKKDHIYQALAKGKLPPSYQNVKL